jgi:hypothetical protein
MTTVTLTASQRRTILANAHATFLGDTRQRAERYKALLTALHFASAIAPEETISAAQLEGTTLCVRIQPSQDLMEIDAYGNTLRGAE